MTEYNPLRQLPDASGYKKGDMLVLCGELFGRGYANGIVDEAKKLGMTVIGTTVGRRDADGTLRPLLEDELAEAEALLGGRIINIPLEAGFDMEQDASGITPTTGMGSVSTGPPLSNPGRGVSPGSGQVSQRRPWNWKS
jgi:hypothetical protein